MNTCRELERVVHKSRRERGKRRRWAPTSHFNKLCPWGWKPWYRRAIAKDFIFTNRIFQSLFHYFLKITTHSFINGMKDNFPYNPVFIKLTVQATCLIDSFSSLCMLVASQYKRRISSLKSNFIPQLDFFLGNSFLFTCSKSYPGETPVQVCLPALKSWPFYSLLMKLLAPVLRVYYLCNTPRLEFPSYYLYSFFIRCQLGIKKLWSRCTIHRAQWISIDQTTNLRKRIYHFLWNLCPYTCVPTSSLFPQ